MRELKHIAVYGGSFNPGGLHHEKIVRNLLWFFNQVVIVPCGEQPNKDSIRFVKNQNRAELAKLAFGHLPIQLDLSDLEQGVFTSTIELAKKYQNQGCVWLVVGTDLIEGGAEGNSLIQKTWIQGEKLWSQEKFVVIKRGDIAFNEKDMPPTSFEIDMNITASSSEIRKLIKNGDENFEKMVNSKVAQYIKQNKLYGWRG